MHLSASFGRYQKTTKTIQRMILSHVDDSIFILHSEAVMFCCNVEVRIVVTIDNDNKGAREILEVKTMCIS